MTDLGHGRWQTVSSLCAVMQIATFRCCHIRQGLLPSAVSARSAVVASGCNAGERFLRAAQSDTGPPPTSLPQRGHVVTAEREDGGGAAEYYVLATFQRRNVDYADVVPLVRREAHEVGEGVGAEPGAVLHPR